MSDAAPTLINLRTVAPTVFIPAVLFGIGQGAIAPIVALSARDLGASVAVASLIVALIGIGQLLGDLPAGSFAAKVGERPAMIGSAVLIVASLVCCIAATSVWMLGAAVAIMGLASAVWGIARHTYLTEVVPYRLRARAMSTLGGSQRIGMFIGPFLGAAAMHWWGTDGAYWVHVASAVGAALLVAVLREPTHPARGTFGRSAARSGGTLRVLADNMSVLRTLGLGALMVGAVRASRQVVIPLWAEHIGLDTTTTSVIFGLAGGVDMLLFYPAGKIMDRFGRVWVAVPCMAVMAVAHLLLPLTETAVTLLAVSLLMSFGNGMGSGIIMTLGADASPDVGRAQFLGGWRLCADLGNAGGPALISGITVAASLGPAILAMAGLGFAGAAALARWVPRRVAPGSHRAGQPGTTGR
jgi:MFS family permease